MPMSPRLLRPIASRLALPTDADARAYVLAVNAADGQPSEKPVVEAIDAFVVGCKADGIWSAIKASCILMGARTLDGALVPLVGTAPTNNNFVSGDYDRETGLLGGGGSGKYIDSNRANDADGQDNQHIAVYIAAIDGTATTQQACIGTGSTSIAGSTYIQFRPSDGLATYESRSNSVWTQSAAVTSPRFAGLNRSSSTGFQARFGGTTTTRTQASATPAAGNIYVIARNQAGTSVSNNISRISFYSIGESLDIAALNARVDSLVAAIGAAI